MTLFYLVICDLKLVSTLSHLKLVSTLSHLKLVTVLLHLNLVTTLSHLNVARIACVIILFGNKVWLSAHLHGDEASLEAAYYSRPQS